ncbi:PP2C family protein-serine/threonine phosphatase, partial [Bifidobacterium pullorum]
MPSDTSQSLFLYSTTVSDVGTVRSNNQDSSFAGEHLVAICDGMGGHAGGDTASTIAIRSLAHIERDDTKLDVHACATMMETSVLAAHDAIVGKAKRERKLAGMGTTVTAVALVEGYWVLAHIGDSRAYLLRDGHLVRMTQDHSYVQHLINTGRITEAEARNHPQRNVVMRVLGDFDIDPRPDIAIRKAHAADRWLLCSDGLSGVLEDSTIQEILSTVADQGECAQQLVAMALRAGSTDNVTAVIADATLALDADAFDLPHQTPLVGGAVSASLEPIADIINEPVSTAPALRSGKDSPAQRAAALTQEAHEAAVQHTVQPSTVREETGDLQEPDTGEIPVVQKRDGRLTADPNDPDVAKAIHREHDKRERISRAKVVRARILIALGIVAMLIALAGAAVGGYLWSQTQYYLGVADGQMAI